MSTAFTLTTLKTAIKNHVEDQGTTFDNNVATIIALGEDRCVKDLDFEMWYVVDATKTLTQGSRVLTLPDGSLRVGDIFITVSSSYAQLQERTYSYLLDYAPGSTQGQPKYWAPYSETQIAVGKVPDSAYPVTMKHLKRPDGLSTTSPSWLSSNLGDLLLDACLSRAEAFLKADERIDVWEKRYQVELAAARAQFAHLLRREF